VDTLLDRALGPEGYYGAFVANMHTDDNETLKQRVEKYFSAFMANMHAGSVNSPGSDAIVNSAVNRGVPVITARQLLTWLDARNNSTFDSVGWTNNTLSFSITASASARGLQGMVPIPVGYNVTDIAYNGSPIGYSLSEIKGMQYAFFTALTGNYSISIIPNVVPLNITALLPQAGATGVNWVPDISVTFREAIYASLVNPNTFVLRDSSGNVIPVSLAYYASTLMTGLTPTFLLVPATTYTATVKGVGRSLR
jgi:hypothetical protein